MKGVMRFGKKKKLVPRYIGPFEIQEKSWHGCLLVGFTSEFISSSSSVPCLDAQEVHFGSFAYVATSECRSEWRFNVWGRTSCDSWLSGSLVAFENDSDGQSLVEEQQRGGVHVGDWGWDAGDLPLPFSSINSCFQFFLFVKFDEEFL